MIYKFCVITRQSSAGNSVDKYWRTMEWKICVCIPGNESKFLEFLVGIGNQSVGTCCHPAVRDTVCPALVSVPDGSSDFKVLIQQRLIHVFSFHVAGKFYLCYNHWELCQCLNKGWVFTLKSAVLLSRYKENYVSKPREG